MRVKMMLLFCVGCMLLGVGVIAGTVDARPLAYQAEFEFTAPESQEICGFLRELNASCRRGDGVALVEGLTERYRTALQAQLRGVGRGLDRSTLREMGRLVPVPDAAGFVLGRSRGDRIAVVIAEASLHHDLEATRRDCLTCIPVAWDGHRFRLAQPRFRHARRAELLRVAAELCEESLSGSSGAD